MAASVVSNDSAAVNPSKGTSAEKGQTLMQVTESLPEKSNLCLDHDSVTHEGGTSSYPKGPGNDATAIKLSNCESSTLTNCASFSGKNATAVSNTKVTEVTDSQSVCQTGDISKKDALASHGSLGVETSSKSIRVTEAETEDSSLTCPRKQLVTKAAELLSLKQDVNNQIKDEATLPNPLTGANMNLECLVQSDTIFDKGTNDGVSANTTPQSTICDQKLAHDKTEHIVKNSFGDSDNRSEVTSQNGKLTHVNLTLDKMQLKPEIGHGDTLGGNKNETQDDSLSGLIPAGGRSLPLSETSHVSDKQASIEDCCDKLRNGNNDVPKMSPDLTFGDGEKLEYMPGVTVEDRLTGNRNVAHTVGAEKENCELTPGASVAEKETARAGAIVKETTRPGVAEKEKCEPTTRTSPAEKETTRTNAAEKKTTRTSPAEKETTRANAAEKETTRTSPAEETTRISAAEEIIGAAVAEKDTTKASVAEKETTKAAIAEKETTRAAIAEKDTTRAAIAEKETTRAAIAEKETTKAAIAEKDTTRAAIAEKETTKAAIAEETTRAAIAEKETTRAAIAEKETTKAAIAEKETTRAAIAEKETTRAAIAEKETTKAAIAEKETTKAAIAEKDTTRAAVAEKENCKLKTITSVAEKEATRTSPAEKETTRAAVAEKKKCELTTRTSVDEKETPRAAVAEKQKCELTTRTNVAEKEATRAIATEKEATRASATEKEATRAIATEKEATRASATEETTGAIPTEKEKCVQTARPSAVEKETPRTRGSAADKEATRTCADEKEFSRTSIAENKETRASPAEKDKCVPTTRTNAAEKEMTRTRFPENEMTGTSAAEETTRPSAAEEEVTRASAAEKELTKDSVAEKELTKDSVAEKELIKATAAEKALTKASVAEKEATRTSAAEKELTRTSAIEKETGRTSAAEMVKCELTTRTSFAEKTCELKTRNSASDNNMQDTTSPTLVTTKDSLELSNVISVTGSIDKVSDKLCDVILTKEVSESQRCCCDSIAKSSKQTSGDELFEAKLVHDNIDQGYIQENANSVVETMKTSNTDFKYLNQQEDQKINYEKPAEEMYIIGQQFSSPVIDEVENNKISLDPVNEQQDQETEDETPIEEILSIQQQSLSPVLSEMENSNTGLISLDEQHDKELSDEIPAHDMLNWQQQPDLSEASIDKPVLETLTFSASKLTQDAKKDDDSKSEVVMDVCVCPLCDREYSTDKKDVLAHLVLMHKFVIADVNFIANLPAYLRYWKARFDEIPVSEFCSKIITNTGAQDEAPKEEFYLLCDALPEDKNIREQLQRKKLESVLAQQQKEREETRFCRQCLFCKQTFCGNRAVLFDHLLRDHTFHVGQPDNLVYTDELFDLIQSKLDNQLCLFCEKSFKDKASLREHMRKKQHRKINPKNKEYDRFYIVNYMEMGKNWESLQSEDNRLIKSNEKDTDEEEEWSGWTEESESKVVCLFCDSSCVVQTELQQHMKEKHSFDLQEVNNRLQLNFYQKVKLINYIRRQVYHRTCYGCQQVFEDKDKLHSHFDEFSDHIKKIPDAEAWDQPQYFFPTYEDDCLLCQLDDDDEGAAGDALGVMVIAETIPVTDTILKDQKLCLDLLKP